MKTAYIFHDSFCDPYSEWYPWMKTTLEGMGYLVVVPRFPSPAGQSYESWKVVVKNYLDSFDDETIFIGHGTGGLFAMRLIEASAKKIRGLFLIASYGEAIGNIGLDRINKTFFEPAFEWKKIVSHATIIRVFAGQGDPFVSKETSDRLAEFLETTTEIIPDGGHLGKAAGFSQLVPVASRIQESLTELDPSIEVEKITPPAPQSLDKLGTAPLIKGSQGVENIPVPPQQSKAHTMYQDMSQLVNSNKGTVASSLLTKARTDKAIEEAASPVSGKNILYTIATVLCAGIIISIGVYLLQKYAPVAQQPAPAEILSLINAEEHSKISLTGEPAFILDQKIKSVLAKPVANETIRDIYYTTPTGRASFPELLKGLEISDVPTALNDELLTSTNGIPVFMHGFSQKNQQASHFLILRIKNYDITFSLMKQWEPTMLRGLGSLMNISSDFLKRRLTKDIFTEELVQNKSVRTLRYHKTADITFDDPVSTLINGGNPGTALNPFVSQTSPYQENDLMIAYFFLNEKTVVITDNLDIIPELLKRYANSQIYQ